MFNIFKKKKPGSRNLKEVLKQFQELEKSFDKVSKELARIKKDNQLHIQKVGLVRFNPFSEVGGNQSFSIALLDGNNSGFVLTSLYTREGNRVYAKAITAGQSKHLLSDEEKKAIAEANGNKKSDNAKAANSGGNGAH